MDESDLPPFLLIEEVLEPEQIPLQVALLTMEIKALRIRIEMFVSQGSSDERDDRQP